MARILCVWRTRSAGHRPALLLTQHFGPHEALLLRIQLGGPGTRSAFHEFG